MLSHLVVAAIAAGVCSAVFVDYTACWICPPSNPHCVDFKIERMARQPGVLPRPCDSSLRCCFKKSWYLPNGTWVTERGCARKPLPNQTIPEDVCCNGDYCNSQSRSKISVTAGVALLAPLMYRN